MLNALSIDVEDYFHVSNFESSVGFKNWDKHESRVERNTKVILSILSEYNVKATFFVLGWVAEKNPQLIREIFDEGHEIASHSYAHSLIYKQTKEQFRKDLIRSKKILEDTIGDKIVGYRAPSFSITKESLWALDILIEEGFLYDSSIFPVTHHRYGIADSRRFPYKILGKDDKCLYEIPLSTITIFRKNIPIAGGGYLRLFPYRFTKWGLNRINKKEKQPVFLYLHPWEIDCHQPRLNGSLLSRFRHYVNLDKMEKNLVQLINDFQFSRMIDYLDEFSKQ